MSQVNVSLVLLQETQRYEERKDLEKIFYSPDLEKPLGKARQRVELS